MTTIEVRRHNGQNAYGPWLSRGEDSDHGEIPSGVYDDAETEMIEDNLDCGHLVSGGQEYDWRKGRIGK